MSQDEIDLVYRQASGCAAAAACNAAAAANCPMTQLQASGLLLVQLPLLICVGAAVSAAADPSSPSLCSVFDTNKDGFLETAELL